LPARAHAKRRLSSGFNRKPSDDSQTFTAVASPRWL
jgi:hypothetical protein